jgi:hypothetical protein
MRHAFGRPGQREGSIGMPWPLRVADLLRAVLAAAVAAALVAGDGGAAVLLAAGLAAAVLARYALLPAPYDLAFVAALTVQCGGEALGLYDAWGGFDTLVHVTVPALTAPVAYLALARLDVVRELREPHHGLRASGDVGVFVVTVSLGLAVGAVWELLEGLSDATLGSELQESVADTNRDLAADGVGATLGALGLVLWSRRGPGSVRRHPRTHEEIVGD